MLNLNLSSLNNHLLSLSEFKLLSRYLIVQELKQEHWILSPDEIYLVGVQRGWKEVAELIV